MTRADRALEPQRQVVRILPGEFHVSSTGDVVATLLGSCVSACIWDPAVGVGGMNHFMIPTPAGHATDPNCPDLRRLGATAGGRYGIFAMEYLVNGILGLGGDRRRLRAKLVGGGHVIRGTMTVGADNIAFARTYLALEGVPIVAERVGGACARRVAFRSDTGDAQVCELPTDDELARRDVAYASSVAGARPRDEIELF